MEGDIAVAVAAIEAKEWAAARTALEPYAGNAPSARVCRLMARIEAGESRDSGRAREWLAKATRGAPDPVWVAPDGTVSPEWQAVAPKSGALGVLEWKIPPASVTGNADDIMAEMSALDVAAIEAEPIPAAPAPGIVDEGPEILPPAKANAQLLPPEGPAVLAGSQAGRGETQASDRSGKEEKKLQDAELAPGDVVRMVPNAASAGKSKPAIRKPNIFVPGPAPDDPGPRSPDSDELTTPLTRFRRPS